MEFKVCWFHHLFSFLYLIFVHDPDIRESKWPTVVRPSKIWYRLDPEVERLCTVIVTPGSPRTDSRLALCSFPQPSPRDLHARSLKKIFFVPVRNVIRRRISPRSFCRSRYISSRVPTFKAPILCGSKSNRVDLMTRTSSGAEHILIVHPLFRSMITMWRAGTPSMSKFDKDWCRKCCGIRENCTCCTIRECLVYYLTPFTGHVVHDRYSQKNCSYQLEFGSSISIFWGIRINNLKQFRRPSSRESGSCRQATLHRCISSSFESHIQSCVLLRTVFSGAQWYCWHLILVDSLRLANSQVQNRRIYFP